MAYTKTTWQDLPSTSTPINATNLNKIENQLETNTSDIATNTSDISTNAGNIATNTTALSNLGTYTTATGQYTTASWAVGTNTCTWTAPATGIYLIFAKFMANTYSDAQPYKQLQLRGTATRLADDILLFQEQASSSYVEGITGCLPVSATQGQTIIPYIHTDVAGKKWNIKIVGIRLK